VIIVIADILIEILFFICAHITSEVLENG